MIDELVEEPNLSESPPGVSHLARFSSAVDGKNSRKRLAQ
jgi:hypothetical protein